MIKRFFKLLVVLVIAIACNNQQLPTDDATVDDMADSRSITEVTVANFTQKAADLVGQEVIMTGMVNHTCKHSGKRMFIVDEGTEESVKVEAGGNIDSFDAELEGSEVIVTGIILERIVDNAYLDEWEEEVLEGQSEELKIHDGQHEGERNEEGDGTEEGETEEEHDGSDLEKIENLRNMLKDSEKDHLSFYSIECIGYEIAPPPPPKGE